MTRIPNLPEEESPASDDLLLLNKAGQTGEGAWRKVRVANLGGGGGGSSPQNAVVSDTTGVTGADQVTNIISLTQAEYDAIATPHASTLYVVTT